MANFTITTLDNITITEKIDVLANGTRKITVSDTLNTAENVDVLRAGARNITTLDTTVTSENTDVLRAGARNIATSDMTFNTENVGFSILTAPANINRKISLTLVVPPTLPFIVTKKNV